ncbi:MAG: pyrimidine-nucleoside phosphorylase [Eubacteriales bacterium]|nr:pyrimidine-nucleoside phosphorylase [Eubacteriales bacterium]
MRMVDLIIKKRSGLALNDEEIRWMIRGFTDGSIPDYQMSAMLMAIYFQGMTEQETSVMTDAVEHSGDTVDLSPIKGVKVDKHSTGGVGDKTTLVIVPIVAACGLKVAKMSGRGLGHTGGTVDKLESIPGFQTDMDEEEFFETVNRTGLCVIGQSKNLTPADKLMYALRDVTGTIDSIPLIAVSIMGKKLAAGNDVILLDVTCGSGAFMKKLEDAVALAKEMTSIGERAGKRTAALITDMDQPLGYAIGNNLEVIEAVEVLKGGGPADLKEVCLALASDMMYLAGIGSLEECRVRAQEVITDGSAFEKLLEMTRAQGGDAEYLKDTSKFAKAPFVMEVTADRSGFLMHMNAQECGTASSMLGAGREKKESSLDLTAGIVLSKKTGDTVQKGEVLARLYSSKEELLEPAAKRFLGAIEIGAEQPKARKEVLARVEAGKVDYYID